jgi:hypothetical protein
MNITLLHFRIPSVQRMFNWWLSQFCACQDGEPDPTVLERMALLELQIRPTLVSSVSRESVRFDDQVGGRFRNNF